MIPFQGNKVTVNTSVVDKHILKALSFYGITDKSHGEAVRVFYDHSKLIDCCVKFHVPLSARKKMNPSDIKRLGLQKQKILFTFDADSLYAGILRSIYKPKKHPLTRIFK